MLQDCAPDLFWRSFCEALGAEPREAREIKGISGLTHQVEAIGVDEKSSRVLIVSREINPRIAALMRSDIQATMPTTKVLVARPLTFDLTHIAQKVFLTEKGSLNIEKLLEIGAALQAGNKGGDQLRGILQPDLDGMARSFTRNTMPTRMLLQAFIEQATRIDWSSISKPQNGSFIQPATEAISQLLEFDSMKSDLDHGICPIPTYELNAEDWDSFCRNQDVIAVREKLQELGVYQYFYPPADQLTLGLIEHGAASDQELTTAFDLASQQGHKVDKNEFIDTLESLPETLKGLKRSGYVFEGEFTNELSDHGKIERQKVKFHPQEGLITRLSKIISIKVELNLQDFTGKK